MFLNVPNFIDTWPKRLGPFFTSCHQDRCQEIKFFVGSIFSSFYLPRNLPVKGLNKEYYIWNTVLVGYGLKNEECYIWGMLVLVYGLQNEERYI